MVSSAGRAGQPPDAQLSADDGELTDDGLDGEDGLDGDDGLDGEDGLDGDDGLDGEDVEAGEAMLSSERSCDLTALEVGELDRRTTSSGESSLAGEAGDGAESRDAGDAADALDTCESGEGTESWLDADTSRSIPLSLVSSIGSAVSLLAVAAKPRPPIAIAAAALDAVIVCQRLRCLMVVSFVSARSEGTLGRTDRSGSSRAWCGAKLKAR